jgi:hypothetical protein
VDGVLFNPILWRGLMGNKPYPTSLIRTNERKEREDREERREADGKPPKEK